MLKDEMNQYLEKALQYMTETNETELELFKEEKEYAEKHELIPDEVTLIEKKVVNRFEDAYMERCDKETEQVLAEETSAFLNQPITYFHKNKNEFLYLESKWFDLIGVDAVSFEVDDVFGTYDCMLGLKLQKKYEGDIKQYLQATLQGDQAKFDLMFSQDDGLWNLNFTVNFVDGFQEEMSIGDAYNLIYHLLFKLVEAVQQK